MQFNQIFSSLALLSLTAAAAVPGPKVIGLPLNRRAQATNGTLSKRNTGVETALGNQNYYYSVQISLGNPGQSVSVDIDTGSSDLWVDTNAYDPSASSDYQGGSNAFQIGYGDGTSASGTFVTDDITLGSTTLKNGNFALATQSTLNPGSYVFGIGYTAGEAAAKEYPNFPIQLKQQGFIESTSYSLWLNDWNDSEGSLLFGGVDHALYNGKLNRVPVVSNIESYGKGHTFRPSKLQRLSVVLNSVGISANGKSAKIISGAHTPVLIDTGTTYGVLPSDWVQAIASTIGATYNKGAGAYLTSNYLSGSLELEFSGVTIQAPLDAFLRPQYDSDGNQATINGEPAYLLAVDQAAPGVHIDDGTIYILGDAFLSGAYIAFDLDNNVIGLANANLGVTSDGSQIEAIGSDGIPGVDAPGYATATSSDTVYALHTPAGFN